jgi:hypothetical protein
VQAQEVKKVEHGIDVHKQLVATNAACWETLNKARTSGDGELVLRSVDRVLKQLELQAKLLGQLDERPQVSLLLAPEWVAVRTTLLNALAPHPAARADVARALLALGHTESNGHQR